MCWLGSCDRPKWSWDKDWELGQLQPQLDDADLEGGIIPSGGGSWDFAGLEVATVPSGTVKVKMFDMIVFY